MTRRKNIDATIREYVKSIERKLKEVTAERDQLRIKADERAHMKLTMDAMSDELSKFKAEREQMEQVVPADMEQLKRIAKLLEDVDFEPPVPDGKVLVDAETQGMLIEAYEYGQFSDDFDRPLAKPIRKLVRNVCEVMLQAAQNGE